MTRRLLADGDLLPLTCTRAGTCCHGKDIRITPWELALLASARGMAPAAFREAHTSEAGTRLRLAEAGWRGLPACSQYNAASGCRVHAARPLACRLYPLGREVQGAAVRIFHEGAAFPCLDGCPDVVRLPAVRVVEYLAEQGVAPFAAVRDGYLEMAQDLAEAALQLALDGELADRRWQEAWRHAHAGGPDGWMAVLGPWHDLLTAPVTDHDPDDGLGWLQAHARLIQQTAEESSALVACARLYAAALLLLHAVGGDERAVGGQWAARAGV